MNISKENIIGLFYIDHLKVKDIAETANTLSAYITKIVKQDTRYMEEKAFRKNVSKNRQELTKPVKNYLL